MDFRNNNVKIAVRNLKGCYAWVIMTGGANRQTVGRLSVRDAIQIFFVSVHLVPVTHELIELPAWSLVLLDTAPPEHNATRAFA